MDRNGYGETKYLGAGHVTELPDGTAIFSCCIGNESFMFLNVESAVKHATNHTRAQCQMGDVFEAYPKCDVCGVSLTADNIADHQHQPIEKLPA